MGRSKKLRKKVFESSYQNLVMDSELLVLYLVGRLDLNKITRYQQTEKFTVRDYSLLVKLIGKYRNVFVTQAVLTETFNHLDRLNRQSNYILFELVKHIFQVEIQDKTPSTYDILESKPVLQKFGFADSSLEILSKQFTILTNDGDLYGYVSGNDGIAIHFDSIKQMEF